MTTGAAIRIAEDSCAFGAFDKSLLPSFETLLPSSKIPKIHVKNQTQKRITKTC